MNQSTIENQRVHEIIKRKYHWKDFIKQDLFELIKFSDSGLFEEKRFLRYDNNTNYLILYDENQNQKKRIKISYLNADPNKLICEANEFLNSRKEILRCALQFQFMFLKKGLERIRNHSTELIFKDDNNKMEWHFKKILTSEQYHEALQKNKNDEQKKKENDIRLPQMSSLEIRPGQIGQQQKSLDIKISRVTARDQSIKTNNNSILNILEKNVQMTEAEYILDFFGITV